MHAVDAHQQKPLADSPWFWVILFASMALVALVAIMPKHYARQERLERMRQTRDDIVRRQASEAVGAGAVDGQPSDARPLETSEELRSNFTTLPLAIILVAIIVVGVVGLYRSRAASPAPSKERAGQTETQERDP